MDTSSNPRSERLRAASLLVCGCLAAGLTSWVAFDERLPWSSKPAEARGTIAPYTLPVVAHADPAADVAFLQARIARQPGDFSDLATLGGLYVKRARATNDPAWYLLAEQAARRSLVNMPRSNPAALLILCQVAQARHDFAGAARLAAQVAVTHPIAVRPLRITIATATGHLDEAAKLADAGVADDPTGGTHIQRALVREARGDDAGAVADYRWAIAREEAGYPDLSVMARTWLGRLNARQGHLDAAVDLYHEALHIAPQNGLALSLLAAAELRRHQPDAAATHFQAAVDAGQGAPAMLGLAQAEAMRGHPRDAARWTTEAETTLRREIGSGGFGHRRDLAKLLLARHTPAASHEAVGLMAEELKLRQDATTWNIDAEALAADGRWQAALAASRHALASGARDPEMHATAGRIEAQLGHAAAAASQTAAAKAIDPSFSADAEALPMPEAAS